MQDKSLRSVQQKEITSTEEEDEEDEEEEEEDDEEEEALNDSEKSRELSMLSRVKRKRRQKSNYSWETKKLNCADCGRWFPSTTLLDAHSLQHGTKKSGTHISKLKIFKKEKK